MAITPRLPFKMKQATRPPRIGSTRNIATAAAIAARLCSVGDKTLPSFTFIFMPNSFWAMLGVMSRMRRGVNTRRMPRNVLVYMIGQKGRCVKHQKKPQKIAKKQKKNPAFSRGYKNQVRLRQQKSS